eukprot:5383523-Pleurochrysis_carterae.AAC.6
MFGKTKEAAISNLRLRSSEQRSSSAPVSLQLPPWEMAQLHGGTKGLLRQKRWRLYTTNDKLWSWPSSMPRS